MSTRERIPGIPTHYRNTSFRSRLESRFAILFDLLKIDWEYEPDLPLSGYIPDFLLNAEIWSNPQVSGPILVEVRPVLHADGFADVIAKIARSGWTGPAIVCGATMFPQDTVWGRETPFGRAHPVVSPAHADAPDEWFPVGWYSELRKFGMGGDDMTTAWRMAGQRNQWMPPRPGT